MGPQGTGGLYISENLDVLQMKEGGTGSRSEELDQPIVVPDRYESGTPNTAGIVGLGEGVGFILERGTAAIRGHEEELTGMLLQGLSIRGKDIRSCQSQAPGWWCQQIGDGRFRRNKLYS